MYQGICTFGSRKGTGAYNNIMIWAHGVLCQASNLSSFSNSKLYCFIHQRCGGTFFQKIRKCIQSWMSHTWILCILQFSRHPVSNTHIHLPELPISNISLSSLPCFYYFISELHAWMYCILILSDPSNTFQNLPTPYMPSLFFLIIPWVGLVLPRGGWVEGYPWGRATWERPKRNWRSLLWQPSTTRDSQLEVGPCETPLPKLLF